MREDRRDVGLGERPELEARDIGAARQAGHDVGQQRRAAGLGVTVGRHHQQPHAGVGPQQVAQEHQGQLVGPVHVVQDEQHGRRGTGGLQQRAGGIEHA